MRYVKHNLGTYFGYPLFIVVPQNIKDEEVKKIIKAFEKTLNAGYNIPLAMQTGREMMESMKLKK